MHEETKRCAIYTRTSYQRKDDQHVTSIRNQQATCQQIIETNAHLGWRTIPKTYSDQGASGSTLDRPGLQCLLTDIRRGEIDIVIFYTLNRLSRNFMDFSRLVKAMNQHGVHFISIAENLDTSTTAGRLTLQTMLMLSDYQLEDEPTTFFQKIKQTIQQFRLLRWSFFTLREKKNAN
ncbi:recombinase family protein [Teredinibacter sp. KSP-S5-2]|uniref:recombinase family protein n=1 Tax=Teredinibacter sp. KSP-S5-2 TaxID=3034506 RepID=UPI00293493C9|nr:recombinase family protein [Teredinibacter sp. KSP-S5-2]WNO10382.1 recombinase family protein [Teredinibacter sp. KSP-S5-2]